jgi:hypothetical protein
MDPEAGLQSSTSNIVFRNEVLEWDTDIPRPCPRRFDSGIWGVRSGISIPRGMLYGYVIKPQIPLSKRLGHGRGIVRGSSATTYPYPQPHIRLAFGVLSRRMKENEAGSGKEGGDQHASNASGDGKS